METFYESVVSIMMDRLDKADFDEGLAQRTRREVRMDAEARINLMKNLEFLELISECVTNY